MKKEACINFVKHEELGKYPFEKSIKYTDHWKKCVDIVVQ